MKTRPEMALCFITGRKLCREELTVRAEKVLSAGAGYLMVREKDLPEEQLLALAKTLSALTARHGKRLIVNSSLKTALEVGSWGVQLPFDLFLKSREEALNSGLKVGVSIHSKEQALAAQDGGADFVLAGHVFPTECKSGQPGRGLDFLHNLKINLNIPFWAVGGITPDNIDQVLTAGAQTACVMSTLLQCADPAQTVAAYLTGNPAAPHAAL
jgi:thiamine-phosphate pyrophosphorylase